MLRVFSLICLLGAATPGVAQDSSVRPLLDAIGMPKMLEIMRLEGLSYSETLEADMFPGQGGTRWTGLVDEIYQTDRMAEVVEVQMQANLPAQHLQVLEAFFTSERGERIVGLELEARRVLLDEDVEEMARKTWRAKDPQTDTRQQDIASFIEANDLIETNVMGALNSNFAFYLGLNDGNAFQGQMTEADMLADVWQQEADIRAETTEWVYAFLTLAYEPLSDADMGAYVDLSKTEAGKALNSALFASFDVLFDDISRDLGFAAAQIMVGEDI